MVNFENTELKSYLRAGEWFVGNVKDDCRQQWVLLLARLAHCSQTCRPQNRFHCKQCPIPEFNTTDLSDPLTANREWTAGSACFYDEKNSEVKLEIKNEEEVKTEEITQNTVVKME